MLSHAKRHSVSASSVGWYGRRWSPPCRGPPQCHSSCGWGPVMLVWTLSWMPSWNCWACGWHLHSSRIHMRWPGWCMQSAAGQICWGNYPGHTVLMALYLYFHLRTCCSINSGDGRSPLYISISSCRSTSRWQMTAGVNPMTFEHFTARSEEKKTPKLNVIINMCT